MLFQMPRYRVYVTFKVILLPLRPMSQLPEPASTRLKAGAWPASNSHLQGYGQAGTGASRHRRCISSCQRVTWTIVSAKCEYLVADALHNSLGMCHETYCCTDSVYQ